MQADATDPPTLDRSLGIDTARGQRACAGDPTRYQAALARFAATYRDGLPVDGTAGAWHPTAEALRAVAHECFAIGATGLAIEALRIERSLHEYDLAGRALEAERYGRLIAHVAARLPAEGGAADAASKDVLRPTTASDPLPA